MSVEPILKNIFFFVKILNQTCSKDVADWGLDSWQNAFQWATYCEQLYHQVINKSMKADFEQYIQRLNSLKLSLVCGQINLKFLKKASCNLTQLLLQNPYLPENLFEKTINVCMEDRQSVIMQCVDQNWQNASIQAVDKLKSCLDYCGMNTSDDNVHSSKKILPEIEAKFIWDRLNLSLRTCQDFERFQATVKKVVTSLNKSKTGWDILLHLLQQNQYKCANLLDRIPAQIHSLIEDHMCDCITLSPVPSQIWKSNRAILNEILAQSFLVFSACLTQLIQWGNQFVPVYQYEHNSYFVWIYQPNKSNDEPSSFETLTSYVQILMDSGPRQKKAVLTTLRSLETSLLCCIWQDILAKIMKGQETFKSRKAFHSCM